MAATTSTHYDGDRCPACATPWAGDQRYCLECGERRGQARFSTMGTGANAQAGERPPRRATRLTAGTTLIAGVGTLLLAMGIGVLIGRTGPGTASAGSSRVQVVTVGAGLGGSPTPSASSSQAGSKAAGHKGSSKARRAHRSKSTATTAQTSSTVTSLPPPTVTVGAKGHGPGYTHGHFTGKFFGP